MGYDYPYALPQCPAQGNIDTDTLVYDSSEVAVHAYDTDSLHSAKFSSTATCSEFDPLCHNHAQSYFLLPHSHLSPPLSSISPELNWKLDGSQYQHYRRNYIEFTGHLTNVQGQVPSLAPSPSSLSSISGLGIYSELEQYSPHGNAAYGASPDNFLPSPQLESSYQPVGINPTVLETPAAPHTTPAAPRRPQVVPSSRDAVLLEGRRRKLTYRKIKEIYNLPESESTLRGRYRNLTVPREHRQRKPVWQDNDVDLLRTAVNALAVSGHGKDVKVSWTRVAQFMQDQGASYPFANATCKRKWLTVSN
ncbi:hypothetical protein KEM54_005155 [Ascosphaera aggregata]|nr:hypothetical protein KEM54_005155 [Ascosphaera aggregata]